MSNRSHNNTKHIGMNLIKKRGLTHASEQIISTEKPKKTFHSSLIMDILRKNPVN
ncbi:MAG: hypothetical protein ACKPE3_38665 [Sphaerospermopsis kisseleviana]